MTTKLEDIEKESKAIGKGISTQIVYGNGVKRVPICDLLENDIVTIEVTDFNGHSAKIFEAQMAKALQNGQKAVVVNIDSYGGGVYAALRMVDAINHAKESGCKVITSTRGKAMSCGSLLLAAGDERYVGKYATVMIHQVSTGAFGKMSDVEISVEEAKRLQTILFKILDSTTKDAKPYWEKRVQDNKYGDLYLTADECLDAGLATHVGTPTLIVSVDVKYSVL